jgi:short-subunit dehydrogenase
MKKPETILITGASSGIGQALARAYAAPGIKLLLTGRDINRLSAIEKECREKGAFVETCSIPVTLKESFQKHITEWDDRMPIDLVIANAGISGGSAAGSGFDDIIDINLDGTFNTVQPLIPRMTARRRGQVALMSSMAGWRGMPNAPAYSTTKVAVRAYGEAIRPLLAKNNVRVSVIFPGFIKTPLTDANNFHMPFLISAEEAAEKIKSGLEKNCARIAFPWQMLFLSRLIAALPLWLGDIILMKAPKKP